MCAKSIKRNPACFLTALIFILIGLNPITVFSQAGPPDIIQSVQPASANQGDSNVVLTITLA